MSLIGKKLLSLTNKSGKRQKNLAMPSYERSQNIGILYTFDEKKQESADAIIKLIDDSNKKIDVLCFIDRKEVESSKHPFFKIEQLNNWGKIKSEEVDQFINTSFDFLIHLDFEMNEIMKNMLIHTKAKCRVGFHAENSSDYYELMIGMNKSAGSSNFAEQTIKYIKAIR